MSSILPNKNSFLPSTPVDGQVFVDSKFIKWIYDAENRLWDKIGQVQSIPLATESSDGLLSPQLKSTIDSIPQSPGGFGLIVDTKTILKSPSNPDGIISGNVKLVSDSIDITCVGPNNRKITSNDPIVVCDGQQQSLPSLKFGINDLFLQTFYFNSCGPKGKSGDKGDTGPDGDNGYIQNGPPGVKGLPGENITQLCELAGIKFKDIDGLTDKVIVRLEAIDDKLVVTKGIVNSVSNKPADKLVILPIGRSLVFEGTGSCGKSRLRDWKIVQAQSDTSPTNVQLIRLAKGSDESSDSISINGTMDLNTFVTQIIEEYVSRLAQIDQQWGKQVKEYMQSLDDNARGILSDLANQLAMCEFNIPAIEYCITLNACKTAQSTTTTPSLSSPRITSGTANPTGGNVGDIYLQYS